MRLRTPASAAAVHRRTMSLADPARAKALQRFFKTAPGEYAGGDRFLGITVPALRQLVRVYRELPLREAAHLLKSPWHEERLLALLILVEQYRRADAPRRDAIYRCYLRHRRRINNWDLVDCSAEHIVGAHLRTGAGGRGLLRELATSRFVWDRRIAVLATFHFMKAGEFTETLSIAAGLADRSADLIHKAVPHDAPLRHRAIPGRRSTAVSRALSTVGITVRGVRLQPDSRSA